MISVVRLPIELRDGWKRSECTIEKTAIPNVFHVVAHDIQSSVAVGTREECLEFLSDREDFHDNH